MCNRAKKTYPPSVGEFACKYCVNNRLLCCMVTMPGGNPTIYPLPDDVRARLVTTKDAGYYIRHKRILYDRFYRY